MSTKIITFFIFLIFSSVAVGWTPCDVSVLLPLPKTTNDSGLLKPETQGHFGPLIPPEEVNILAADLAGWDQLRVVGIRLDPCFPTLDFSHPEKCRAQIRLIWQPLVSIDGQITSLDSAVHSFYEISQTEFQFLLGQIKKLKDSSGLLAEELSISIHPTIAHQGLLGSYWQNLRKYILALTGGHRLSRLTFIAATIPRTFWNFQGFDFINNSIHLLKIPLVNGDSEELSNLADKKSGFLGGLGPKPEGPDNLNALIENSAQFALNEKSVRQEMVNSLFRLENPKINNSETIDCASCHLAQGARSWAQRNFKDLDFQDNRFNFLSSLAPSTGTPLPDATVNLRNFGYFGREVSVSQRTINETSIIVEKLNALSKVQR